jgi:hypothetical protein
MRFTKGVVMSEIEKLIETDAENISHSRRILAGFDPELSLALETAAGMFTTFSRCIEGATEEYKDLSTFKQCCNEMGVEEEKLIEIIESKSRDNPILDRARSAWFSIYGRRVRGIIFLLLQRQFMWAVTDLLRMRITPAIGYTRLEAESLALLLIMKKDPSVANRWMSLTSDKEGKAFYKEFQGQIIKELKNISLDVTYEMGSGASLHVRFASAIRNLSFKNKPGKSEIWLGYQELKPGNGFNRFQYFLQVLSFLRTQERIFRTLADAFPEVSDPIWFTRVDVFARTVDVLWQKLEKTFPNECEKYRQRIAGQV